MHGPASPPAPSWLGRRRAAILFPCVLAALPGPFAPAAAAAVPSAAATDLVSTVTRENDGWIDAWIGSDEGAGGDSRAAAGALPYLAASYAGNPRSAHYHDRRLLEAMAQCAGVLQRDQQPDGYFDSKSNLRSAPDTGFLVVPVCKAYRFLQAGDSPDTLAVRAQLERTIRLAGRALLEGGVQTANHRWGICDGLARINELFPAPAYEQRMQEWLDEGLDNDSEGQWAERSPHYSGDVDDAAVLDLALVLRRPELLAAVRRNLRLTVYLMEPNGDLETVASRKPDQRRYSGAGRALDHPSIWEYYLPYRVLALRDRDPTFAAMARFIEQRYGNEIATSDHPLNMPLPSLLEWPEWAAELPPGGALPARYERFFALSGLARIRQDAMTATIFGGTDIKLGLGVGPGLSSNPTFFSLRKGRAVLESVRMTPDFFDTGFFYADGLALAGGVYRLHQTLSVPYYEPLPPAARRADGVYPLTDDGRFSAAMEFGRRQRDNLELTSTVEITQRQGAFQLDFAVTGYDRVPVTIELTFGADGVLSGDGLAAVVRGGGRRQGADARPGSEDLELRSGFGRFQVGGDVIQFGPGAFARRPGEMEGEAYDWLNGNLRIEGRHVYLTGVTPFHHRLTIR